MQRNTQRPTQQQRQRPRAARAPLAIAFALIASLALAAGKTTPEAAAQPAREPGPETTRESPQEGPAAPPPAASTAEDAAARGADAVAGGAGLRVRLDPRTGEIVGREADPAAEQPVAEVRGALDRLNTYSDDLLQEPLPQGGFRVDLRGRFQSAVVATIDPETGGVEIDCVASPAPAEVADDG